MLKRSLNFIFIKRHLLWSVTLIKIKLIAVCVVNCNPGVPGVGAAVQSVQSAAEQGLSAAMMKMQVCVGGNTTVQNGCIILCQKNTMSIIL